MSRSNVWPWMRPFLILIATLAVPPFIYWFGYVQSRTLDERRFAYSTLSAVTAAFSNRLVAYDKIAGTADKYVTGGARGLTDYLSSILKVKYPSELKPARDQPVYRLKTRPETGELLLLVSQRPPQTGFSASSGKSALSQEVLEAPVPLQDLIAWETVQTQFDGLLVISPNNRLIAQDRRLPLQPLGQPVALELRNANPAFLAVLSQKTSVPGSSHETKGAAATTRSDTPRAGLIAPDFKEDASIQLGGVDYAVFLQVVSAPLTPLAGIGDNPPSLNSDFPLLVCGLISRERLNRSVFQLSPLILAQITSVVLLCLFAIPFLKLRFIGERERMQQRDVWLLAGSILSATALVTLAIFDWRGLHALRDRFDTGLLALTNEVAQHLEDESRSVFQELTSSAPLLLADGLLMRKPTRNSFDSCPEGKSAIAETEPVGSILTQPIAFESYPDFEALVLTDLCGQQIRKFMTRTLATPNINTSEQPYFPRALTLENGSGMRPGSQYAFSTVLAPTSGLMLGVYAIPYSGGSPKTIDAPVGFVNRSGVAALAVSMRSVNSPIVARPFQFVVVDSHGAVVFQYSQGSFRGERFFDSVTGGNFLERAAHFYYGWPTRANLTAADSATYQYRGRAYRMLGIYEPGLQLTLVGFYEESIVETLTAQILASAAIYMLVVIGMILLVAGLSAFVFGQGAFRWAWPSTSATLGYISGSVACGLYMVLLLYLPAGLPSVCLRWLMILAPAPVILLLGTGKVASTIRSLLLDAGSGKIAKAFEQPAYMSAAYTLFAVSVLCALVAWPAGLALNDALRLHLAQYSMESAQSWHRARSQWLQDIHAAVVDTGGPLDKLDCNANPDPRCSAPDQLYAFDATYRKVIESRTQLSIYHTCVSRDSTFRCLDNLNSSAPYSLVAPLARWLSHYRNPAAEQYRTLSWVTDSQSRATAPGAWKAIDWQAVDLMSLIWVPISLWLLVRSIATHVLGISVFDERILDGSQMVQPVDGSTWLLLRPRRQLLSDLVQPVATVDLRRAEPPAQLTAPEKGETVLIEHFEAQIANKEWRMAVLSLLRRKSAGCVMVTCEIDPLFYVSQRVREKCDYLTTLSPEDKDKRTEALCSCGELRDELAAWATTLRQVQRIRQPIPALQIPSTVDSRVRKKILQECSATDSLIEIGEQLAKRPGLQDCQPDDIIALVRDAADPYYRSLWELCSREERLVLVQLAEVGLVNPKRQDLLLKLARRGLVKVDPVFRLMNTSFERFVCTAEPPLRVVEWEHAGSGLTWSRLGTPLYALAAMVIAVLLFAEHGLVTDILATATSSAATLGSLRNLYTSITKGTTNVVKPA